MSVNLILTTSTITKKGVRNCGTLYLTLNKTIPISIKTRIEILKLNVS